jgi:DNA-cytosine methyltransferase
MNVLSLFDGMSCGQIALNKAGIKYHNYFACEIDKYAIQVAQENFPNTVQLGDVTKVGTSKSWSQGKEIGVLVSPCQGFSFAGKQLNFDDPRSKLFFEFVRLKDNLQPKYFLLENVKMKKESEDIITKYLGVEPIEINSSLFSAQSRRRLYWTNIPFDKQIQDKGIVLKDILQDLPFSEIPNYLNNKWCGRRRGDMVKSITDDKAHCLTASMWKGQIPTFVKKPIQVGEATNIKGFDVIKRVYSPEGKSPTLTTMQGGHREPKVAIEDELYRKLTPLECERLQTVPDNYTNHVSKTQRYKMLGNGWTVDVVAHIFGGINE